MDGWTEAPTADTESTLSSSTVSQTAVSHSAGWTTRGTKWNIVSLTTAKGQMLLLRFCSAGCAQLFRQEGSPLLNVITLGRYLSTSTARTREASYYDDLGLDPGASSEEIKSAFYKLSKENHPDMNRDDPIALTKFKSISEAYNTLSNPRQRTKYDKGVLGRTSSVAEREQASHRFEGENFYQARGGSQRDSRNLDNWVKEHRMNTFSHQQHLRKMREDKKMGNIQEKAMKSRGASYNQDMAGFGVVTKFFLYCTFFLLLVIVAIMA